MMGTATYTEKELRSMAVSLVREESRVLGQRLSLNGYGVRVSDRGASVVATGVNRATGEVIDAGSIAI